MRAVGGVWVVCLAFPTGCRTPWDESVEGTLRLLELSKSSSASGMISVGIPVEQGEGAMLVTVQVQPDELAFVDRLYTPSGDLVFDAQEYWSSPYTRTYGAFSSNVVVFNWPITPSDVPLKPGAWMLHVRTEVPKTESELTVVLKRDRPLDGEGDLKVNVLFAGDLADDNELVRGTMAAIDTWTEDIYAPIGIDLEATIATWEGPEDLLSPLRTEGTEYMMLAQAKALDEINIVVVDRILDGVDVLGVAGGIPGALTPTRKSAVAASALEAAGTDRVFSALEEQLLAETLAHEVGHYLGLFHPVELPSTGINPTTWDGLLDTPECQSMDACEAELSDNLMYPSPVCLESTAVGCVEFAVQNFLTVEQAGVAHHYTGVK
jgi:hypothetical protein